MADNSYSFLKSTDDIEGSVAAPTSAWTGYGNWNPNQLSAPTIQPPSTTGTGGYNSDGTWNYSVDKKSGTDTSVTGYNPYMPTGQSGSSPVYSWGLPVFGQDDGKGNVTSPVTPDMSNYWTNDTYMKGVNNWVNTILPYSNALQAAYQYETDSAQSAYQWQTEQGWQQQLDQYNADLATRQQLAAENQQATAENQWQQQFDWQKQGDLIAQDIAQREITLAEQKAGRELTLQEREQVFSESYRNTQLQLQQQQINNEALAARYAAFGRSQAPTGFVANWG